MKVTALILAAGYSSRMGSFKPLLPLAGQSALERCVALFRAADVADVRVVTGHRADELAPLLQKLEVRAISNPHFAEGMFSSVVAGLASLEEDVEACLVLPVDLPLVRPATVRSLLQEFTRHPAWILYPSFAGERGHPPLIAGDLARRLPAWPGRGGLQGALSAWEDRATNVAVADELILRDMDRPDDFQQLQHRALRLAVPSRKECRAIWALSWPLNDPVVLHCRTVANLAVKLGTALNAAGLKLDLELLEAAALLHDLARCEPGHARVGAERLKGLGFPEVAELVAGHMDLPLPLKNEITEVEILFLADKLVQGEQRVSLAERFAQAADRFCNDLQVKAKIAARMATAQAIQQRMEQLWGRSLTEHGF